MIAAGQQVGEYIVERQLGEGAFGSVYAAVHPVIEKRAAIKVLAARYSNDAETVSRFVAEARAVNKIRHENIIDIFAFGELDDGRQYFAMELLEGQPLDEVLKERSLPDHEILAVLEGVGAALDAAHAAGIAHRDLKPANIFLARHADGRLFPKLLDFGIAKLLHEDEQRNHKTGPGVAMGTPYFMSPEQCEAKAVDHRTDAYAFGVLAFFMFTGRYPFTADSSVELMMKHMREPPPPVRTIRPELPQPLEDVVVSLMAKDAAARPTPLTSAVSTMRAALVRPVVHNPPIQPAAKWPIVLGVVALAGAIVFALSWGSAPETPAVVKTIDAGVVVPAEPPPPPPPVEPPPPPVQKLAPEPKPKPKQKPKRKPKPGIDDIENWGEP